MMVEGKITTYFDDPALHAIATEQIRCLNSVTGQIKTVVMTVASYGFDCFQCEDGEIRGRMEREGDHNAVRSTDVKCDSCDATYTVEVHAIARAS